ncbi:hypothetical protein QTH81_15905 [Clostridium perfringens]|uniref:hypothetical protein n=1 Tax=Clostridium perfringens TaxID=1502 RepID=UPI001ABA2F53|nr:hypothetical protein [Clostridium perfringens]MBO3392324.1 hypothetical protein [Clostridium perfringens]MDM0719748.1 hypothetical protein [Clostridium perfringens]
MKKEVLDYNSKMMEIYLKELEEYVETKENNKDEKIVEKKKAIKGIRKYRLGYDYLFLPKKPCKYEGDLIVSTSITVLFKIYDINGNEILFETNEEELKEQKLSLRNGEDCYLCDLFKCYFNIFKSSSSNPPFDFMPTEYLFKRGYLVNFSIIKYTKDINTKIFISEQILIDEKEFVDIMKKNLDLFDVSDNKPAQSCSYIAVEVTDEV